MQLPSLLIKAGFQHRLSARFVAALLAVALLAAVRRADGDTLSIERGELEQLVLRDVHGGEHTLAEVPDDHNIVLVFLGVECPLVKLYLPRLEALRQRLQSENVTFWGVDSNRQDTLEELARLGRESNLTMPLLKDPGNRLADLVGAERTPEVVVLDRDRTVRYRGRIDDQYGVGYQRPRAERDDLAVALEELAKGLPVSVPRTEAPGCLIGREAAAAESADVTWAEHIAPLFQQHCQECHRPGQLAPLDLLEYEDVLGWGPTIREVVENRRMPPWHADPAVGEFSNENRLSDEEIALIARWVEQGTPEGDPAQAPPPREFAPEGWRAITPDQIIYMSESPFAVPAEGLLDYQYFTVDPGFTEGRWVRGVECRPGNARVVHHMDVFLLWPGEEKADELRDLLGGYAPGAQPWLWPAGTAKYIPPGAKFVFQVHYTPNGTAQVDRGYMGLEFVDADQVERPVQTATAINFTFEIPPRAEDVVVEATYQVAEDAELLTMTPHMHWRGRTFSFEAIFPDGRREMLLDVPNYDFNWQTTYRLAEPVPLPEGTEIRCVAHFDNSEQNPANPDPNVPVRFGFQTHDEMMIGYFEMAAQDRDSRRSPAPNFGAAAGWPWRSIGVAAVVLALIGWSLWSAVRVVRRSRRAAGY